MKDSSKYLDELLSKDNYVYRLDDEDIVFTPKDFINLAMGNIRYALSLRERVEGQHPSTLMLDDETEGEIIIFNHQVLITDGMECEIITD